MSPKSVPSPRDAICINSITLDRFPLPLKIPLVLDADPAFPVDGAVKSPKSFEFPTSTKECQSCLISEESRYAYEISESKSSAIERATVGLDRSTK